MPLSTSLLRARDAVDRDVDEALQHLLVAWRRNAHPRIAQTIERLSQRCAHEQPSIIAPVPLEQHRQWLAVEARGRPSERKRLLDALTDGSFRQVMQRLARVAAWEPDPRVAMAMAHLVEHARFVRFRSRRFWATVHQLLEELGDVRTLEPLRRRLPTRRDAFAGTTGAWMFHRLHNTVRTVESHGQPAALAGVEVRLLEAIEAAVPDPTTADPLEGLFARVYADPDNVELRMVLADALLQSGEPRGEHILLQLRESLTPEQRVRERRLRKHHLERWLGPLNQVVRRTDVSFEGGFLTRCALVTPHYRWAAELVGHPAWATVREVSYPETELGRRFWPLALENPSMRSLRVVRGIDPTVLPEVCVGPVCRPFHTVGFDFVQLGDDEQRVALSLCTALPDLRRMELSWAGGFPDDELTWLERLLKARVLTRLDSLALHFGSKPPLRSLWKRLDLCAIQAVDLHTYAWTLSLSRDRSSRFRHMRCRPTKSSRAQGALLADLIGLVPQTALTHLVVESQGYDPALKHAVGALTSLEHVEGAGLG